MSVHDTIGDFITVIRNAGQAGKENCSYPHSNLREGIAKRDIQSILTEGRAQVEIDTQNIMQSLLLHHENNGPKKHLVKK